MSLENVMMRGYDPCEAFKWLHKHGGIEGRFEMQTVVTTNEEAVYEAIQKIRRRGLRRRKNLRRKLTRMTRRSS